MVNVTEEPWIRVCCSNKKTSAVFITEHLRISQVPCLAANARHVLTSY